MDAVYPSDLNDSEWAVLRPLLPSRKPRGRKREVDFRRVLNGVFYLNKEGCRWRALPKEYGPWQTVYHYFRLWRISGLWQQLNDKLRVRERQAEGRRAQPSVGIIDSQSAKTTSKKGFAATTRGKRSKVASGT
jgi:putative transposase